MRRPSLKTTLKGENLFLAIAHPIRRAVLEELAAGERPATQLASPHGLSASLLSQHLKVLKDSGLVSERREGRNRIYRLEAAPLAEVSRWVDRFSGFWDDRLAALGKHLLASSKGDSK